MRGGPQVGPGFEHGVAPAGVVGLEPVVPTAQRSRCCRSPSGRPRRRGSRGPGRRPRRGGCTTGTHRSGPARLPGRRAGRGPGTGRRAGARSGRPPASPSPWCRGGRTRRGPGRRRRTSGCSPPGPGAARSSGCRDRVLGEVHVQHHLAGAGAGVGARCRCWCRGPGRAGAGPSAPRASERRTSSEAVEPRSASRAAPAERAVSRSRASARSTSASHPHGALEGHLVRCARGRAGRPRRPPGGAGPRSGMNRTIASSTSRSTPLGRIRCANGATWASTNPAAAGLEARWSARAIRRARHAGRSPDRDPGPGLREPVPQLEGLTEVGLAGLGGQPDRGRELGHTELRDQRRTGSGDRERLVAVSAQNGRVIDRLRRVQVRPGAPRARSRSASAASAAARRSRACSSTAAAVSAAVSRLVPSLVMAPF